MEEEDLIPTITDIARNSPILSVRGYVIILHLSCLGDHQKIIFLQDVFLCFGPDIVYHTGC
jgi:hypothetical protein